MLHTLQNALQRTPEASSDSLDTVFFEKAPSAEIFAIPESAVAEPGRAPLRGTLSNLVVVNNESPEARSVSAAVSGRALLVSDQITQLRAGATHYNVQSRGINRAA